MRPHLIAAGALAIAVILGLYALTDHRWYGRHHVGRWMGISGGGPVGPGVMIVGGHGMGVLDRAFLPASRAEAAWRGAELRMVGSGGSVTVVEGGR